MSVINELKNAVDNGHKTLGDIITWSVGDDDVTYNDIQKALKNAGMEAKFSKELCPRYAFSRACRELEESRVIRKIAETDKIIRFQFTKESVGIDGEKLDYNFECTLDLFKKSGLVSCELPGMAEKAHQLIIEATERRTASDVTKIVQRMFATHADLFPVRPQGGCYFVPLCHLPFVERVERFLSELGGHLNRFPILAGQESGKQSVKTVIAQGLANMIEDHRKAIATLGESSLDSTFETRYESIMLTSAKIEGYSYYLEEQAAGLIDAVSLAKQELAAVKVALVEKAAA